MSVARAWLAAVREDPRARWFALAAAAVVGVAAAQLHWYGFVLGGALVGLASKTPARGLLAGVGFGLLSWGVFAAVLAAHGALWKYAAAGPAFGVSVAIPLAAAALGSLVRGVV